MQKPAATFFAQAVAVAPDRDDVTVVKQPVQDCGRDDCITEYSTPFTDGTVRGDEHCASLVAPADQLKEQMRCIGLERQVAEFVDNQQLGLCIMRQSFLKAVLGLRLGQVRHQFHRAGE